MRRLLMGLQTITATTLNSKLVSVATLLLFAMLWPVCPRSRGVSAQLWQHAVCCVSEEMRVWLDLSHFDT